MERNTAAAERMRPLLEWSIRVDSLGDIAIFRAPQVEHYEPEYSLDVSNLEVDDYTIFP